MLVVVSRSLYSKRPFLEKFIHPKRLGKRYKTSAVQTTATPGSNCQCAVTIVHTVQKMQQITNKEKNETFSKIYLAKHANQNL